MLAQPGFDDETPKAIKHGAVGLKLGIINSGNLTLNGKPTPWDSVDVRGQEMNPNAAATGQLFFDVVLTRKLVLLFSADVYDIRFQQLSERLIDVAAGFKLVFYNEYKRLAWRPGAAVGFGFLQDIGFMRPTSYLTLKAFNELVLFPRGNWAFVFDLGVVAMPSGGNSTVDVEMAPSLYLRVGVLY